MTTIAWDGFVLAADSVVTNGSCVFGHTDKIYKLKDGRYFAAAGSADFIHAVKEWLEGADKPERFEDDNFIGILLTADSFGDVTAYEVSKNLRIFEACVPWAGGSGEPYALAAMKCGKGAEEAVRVACEMDVYSGGEVQIIHDFDMR